MTKLLVLMALCFQCQAQTLVVHAASWHSMPRPSGAPWNEINPGIAARWQQGELAYQAGIYRDSVAKPTVYALADWEPISFEQARMGAFIGVQRNDATSPIAGLVLHRGPVGVRLFPAPKSKGIGIALEFVF